MENRAKAIIGKRKRELLILGIGVNLAVFLWIISSANTPSPEVQFPEAPADELDFIDYAEVSTSPPPADDGTIGLSTKVVVSVGNSTDSSPP